MVEYKIHTFSVVGSNPTIVNIYYFFDLQACYFMYTYLFVILHWIFMICPKITIKINRFNLVKFKKKLRTHYYLKKFLKFLKFLKFIINKDYNLILVVKIKNNIIKNKFIKNINLFIKKIFIKIVKNYIKIVSVKIMFNSTSSTLVNLLFYKKILYGNFNIYKNYIIFGN